jgi:hypothetical protein
LFSAATKAITWPLIWNGIAVLLAYLRRYTRRVAITNSRLQALDRQRGTVTFSYKVYAHEFRRDPYVLQSAASEEKPGESKECPQCAERVRLRAKVCRYCGCHFELKND